MHCEDAATSINWVSSDQDLAGAVGEWQDAIGMDTEFIRTDTFFPVPGLYQIASGHEVYLLDPLGIEDWSPFVAYLEDPRKVKVMHACQEDLELLYHHMGVVPQGVFDSQFANAYLCSDFSLSYARLVERSIGVELDKHETRSNWLKRPLSENQIRYAVEDVVYLVPLYEKLNRGLIESARVDWFAADMQARAAYADTDPYEYYRNVKQAWQLDGGQLAVLRSMAAWREQTARQMNVPRNRVVWDEHLFAFAQMAELTDARLREALPHRIAKRHGVGLQEHHALGMAAAAPGLLHRPLTSAQRGLMRSLRDVARHKADDLGFAQELIARKRDLEDCVRVYLSSGELSEFYAGWRGQLLAEEFRGILQAG